jgi:hypothetical protein
MPGNMTKLQALEWLVKYGAVTRGYPQEVAAAYLGLGVERFLEEVAEGRLPKPRKYGKRLVWDRAALDKSLGDGHGDSAGEANDPVMASINAAKTSAVRGSRSS